MRLRLEIFGLGFCVRVAVGVLGFKGFRLSAGFRVQGLGLRFWV